MKEPSKALESRFESPVSRLPDQIHSASLLIAGLGTIGAALALQMARCGPRRLFLLDRDYVEAKNIGNQDYELSEVGRSKAEALSDRLSRLYPNTECFACVEDLETFSPRELKADLILGGLDSRRARQLLVSELAWPERIPVIDGGVGEGCVGRVQVFVPGDSNACLECTWSQADYRALSQEYPCMPGEPARGYATIAPAFLGTFTASMMTAEAIRSFDGCGAADSFEISFDLRHHRFIKSRLRRNPGCRMNH